MLLLSVRSEAGSTTAAQLRAAGAPEVEVAAAPDAETVDSALAGRDGRRLVVDADLAGLVLVLNRLRRRDELATAEVAVLTDRPVPVLGRVGLPTDRAGQIERAVHGAASLVGVGRDDSGGVWIDSARIEPARVEPTENGSDWWVRAVVDDQRLVDGSARAISVRRLGPAEIEATVDLGRFRRRRARGRSLQLACDEARITQDGVERERSRRKRTFWSDPELWNLVH